MDYFKNCTTVEQVKTLYKELALTHHPDRGGDTATMQAINAEYALAHATLLKNGTLDNNTVAQHIRFGEEYQSILSQIIHLPGIIIQQVGLWVWVHGNTLPVKEQLKSAGLKWAPKKQKWYFRSETLKVLRGGGKKTFDQIIDKYGCETIHPERKPALKHP